MSIEDEDTDEPGDFFRDLGEAIFGDRQALYQPPEAPPTEPRATVIDTVAEDVTPKAPKFRPKSLDEPAPQDAVLWAARRLVRAGTRAEYDKAYAELQDAIGRLDRE